MPAPDTIDPTSSDTMLALVAEQIGKMNGRASPGFDCMAASFIRNDVVVRPKPDGRGSERVNVLAPYIARSQEPLQFYWFRSAVKFWNRMVDSNSNTLRDVMKADISLGNYLLS